MERDTGTASRSAPPPSPPWVRQVLAVYLLLCLIVGTTAALLPRSTWPGALPVGVLVGGLVFRANSRRLAKGFNAVAQERDEVRRELAAAQEEVAKATGQRRQEASDQAALLEVSLAVTSTLQLERVLHEVVTHTQSLMGADGCLLWLRQLDRLHRRASVGLNGVTGLDNLPMNAFSSGLTQFGNPRVLEVGPSSSLSPAVRDVLAHAGYASVVALPLASRGNAAGLLAVCYHAEPAELETRLGLLTTVGSQAAVAIENARLYHDQEHVTRLLRGALAPQPSPQHAGVEVGHRFLASKDLSGDYYDVIPITAQRFGVVIADVAGKGPDAAILTARTKHIIEAYTRAGFSPSHIMTLLNQQLQGTPDSLHLVTVFYGQIDLERRELLYTCAGHEPPLYWTPQQEPTPLPSSSMLVGAMPDAVFSEATLPLEAGTSLLMYTDGVTEARTPDGELFEVKGLMAVLQQWKLEPPQELTNRIFAAVQRFTESQVQDDVSVLVLRIG